MSAQSGKVLLVGSVPLDTCDEVFRTAGELLGSHLCAVPDGETGVRSNWIEWQRDLFYKCAGLEVVDQSAMEYRQLPQATIASGTDPASIDLGSLGYSEAAANSYEVFSRMKSKGEIPNHLRFQVSLPTPLAPIHFYVAADAQGIIEPLYEQAMMRELESILTTVPADELAIQWDTAVEFAILEGVMPSRYASPLSEICDRLIRLGDAVPDGVELGYHLCYGDAGHKHFVEPSDCAKLTEVANAVSAGLRRRLDWVHMPVPRDRHDDAYYQPLAGLELQESTDLYLGLVHMTDGAAGTARRIAAARKVVSDFGVATECGFGRRPASTVPSLMELHAEMAGTLAGT